VRPTRPGARRIGHPKRMEPTMTLAADYPFLDILWSMIIFFTWVVWIWMMITILSDVFRRRDIGGWKKTLWTMFLIVLPFLGVFVYLISNHDRLQERQLERAGVMQRRVDQRVVATNGGGSGVDEIEKAQRLLKDGVIDQSEFDAIKVKALTYY
jgi:hypothetical protein